MKPRVAILTGFGINCDYETEFAFNLAGGAADRIHLNDLISEEITLEEFHIVVFPGGFSFGDDIASGKVLANKFKYNLGDQLQKFISDEKLVLGICNGFQVLVKMGILPALTKDYTTQEVTLTDNDSGKFEARWTHLKPNADSPCIFTQGLENILYLPVAHGEGKFVAKDQKCLDSIKANSQIVLQYVDSKGNPAQYPHNPNGSLEHIAGICDPTGRIFGLMPHPERHSVPTQHPHWTRNGLKDEGEGLAIFKNAIYYVKEHF